MKHIERITGVVAALAVVLSVTAQSKYGATAEDSVKCIRNLSLYQEFMKQGAYHDAYGPWKEVLRVCPGSSKGAYQNGIRLLSIFIDEEKDPARKVRLIDSLNIVYDMRIANFGEEAYVLGRKGVDILIYSPERCEAAYDALSQSVEMAGERSEAGALSGYYQALKGLCTAGSVSKDRLVTEYVTIMGYIETNMANESMKESDREYYLKARDNVNTLFFQVADCADIGRIAGQLVAADPTNMELKTRMLRVLNTKDCTDEKEYRSLAEEVHRSNPSSESAYSLGMYMAKQNELNGAGKYMKEAVDLCERCADEAKYLLKAGQVASALGNHSQARSYANRLLQVEPKNGEALMLIGNAVAAQAAGCQVPDSWGAYWLAYDYYQRAKSLDASVSEKAGDRMASSAARFPTQSEAFFHQLTDGKSVQVTCGGMNESTTVRTRK